MWNLVAESLSCWLKLKKKIIHIFSLYWSLLQESFLSKITFQKKSDSLCTYFLFKFFENLVVIENTWITKYIVCCYFVVQINDPLQSPASYMLSGLKINRQPDLHHYLRTMTLLTFPSTLYSTQSSFSVKFYPNCLLEVFFFSHKNVIALRFSCMLKFIKRHFYVSTLNKKSFCILKSCNKMPVWCWFTITLIHCFFLFFLNMLPLIILSIYIWNLY